MTKDECQEAYQTLMCGCSSQEAYEKSCNTIEQLIEEHFDNPPLSFEELKPGMWVWDIQIRGYKKICYLDGEMKKLNFALWGIDWIEFEPNRFYRKPKED